MFSTIRFLQRAAWHGGSWAVLFGLAGCGLNNSMTAKGDPFLNSNIQHRVDSPLRDTHSLPETTQKDPRQLPTDQEPGVQSVDELRLARGQSEAAEDDLPAQGTPGQSIAAQPAVQPAGPPRRIPVRTIPTTVGRVPDSAIERISAGPRQLPVNGPDDNCPPRYGNCPTGNCPTGNCPSENCGPGCPAEDGLGEDEYLCDGGDRDYPIHFEAGKIAGFDTEDAAVEYLDSHGKRRITPTNKVCVYAPRFGAVTAVVEVNENHTSDLAAGARAAVKGGNLLNRQVASDHHQRDRLERVDVRKRGSELYNPTVRDEIHNIVNPVTQDQTLIAYNDFTYVRTGVMLRVEEARLKLGIQGATEWTRAQFPVIAGHLNSAAKIESQFRGVELVGREPPSKPGILKICKLADRRVAQPGDIITFTIRYDNLGDLPVTGVVISDNLTPRIEYIADSATCDRPGKLLTEENGEGSLILHWELDEPVQGHTGGVISFKGKVR